MLNYVKSYLKEVFLIKHKNCIIKNWALSKYECGIIAWGNVFERPKCYNGQMIRTSLITGLILKQEYLTIETTSSVYHCQIDECFMSDYETKEILCETFPDKTSYFEKLFKKAVKMPEGTKVNHFERGNIKLDKNELEHKDIDDMTYIICIDNREDIYIRNIFIKNEIGELEDTNVNIYTHCGVVQDSIICQDLFAGLDFRFFLNLDTDIIEAYSKDFPYKYNFVMINVGENSIQVEDIILEPNEIYKYKVI